MADKAVLRMVMTMLGDHPGQDEVRLVIHDVDGQDQEFDLARASVSDELTRALQRVVSVNKGTVRVVKPKAVA
jgi:hypothetical protein